MSSPLVCVLMLLMLVLMCAYASGSAVGGLLCQRDDSGAEYPVSFFSCKLTAAQKNWSTIEREAYAVLVNVKKFEHCFSLG